MLVTVFVQCHVGFSAAVLSVLQLRHLHSLVSVHTRCGPIAMPHTLQFLSHGVAIPIAERYWHPDVRTRVMPCELPSVSPFSYSVYSMTIRSHTDPCRALCVVTSPHKALYRRDDTAESCFISSDVDMKLKN